MNMTNKHHQIFFGLSLCMFGLVLSGCASKPQIKSGFRSMNVPEVYLVRPGDTLSGIASRYGMDYTVLAERNNIAPPYRIFVNQRIRLKASSQSAASIRTQQLSPVMSVQRQQVALPSPQIAVLAPEKPNFTITVPNVKENATIPTSSSVLPAPNASQNPVNLSTSLSWQKPCNCVVFQSFDLEKNMKGVGLTGQFGDAIYAAANGQVVYADDGLKEYGNLVLIKHQDGYISAYAHNRKLLVNKDDIVTSGQKIAEMGGLDSSKAMLEFQIRFNGKPIDPRSVVSLN